MIRVPGSQSSPVKSCADPLLAGTVKSRMGSIWAGPCKFHYGPQAGYAWTQAGMVCSSPYRPITISMQAHKNHTKITGLGPDMGPDISAVGMLDAYCDVPGSPCLSKKRVKCTAHFFLKFFIGSYG